MTFVRRQREEMVELIPALCESDEIDNVDSVVTWNYCEVIYFCIFPFTCEPHIKIALPETNSPLSWLKVFFFLVGGGRLGGEGFVT